MSRPAIEIGESRAKRFATARDTQGEHLILIAVGHLYAIFPVVAKLPDKIERAGNEDGVVRSGMRQRVVQSFFGVVDYERACRMVSSDFRKLRGGDGTRVARLSEDYFCGEWKEDSSDFVDGFIAHGAENQANIFPSEILAQKCGEFPGGRRVMSAVKVNAGFGSNLLDATGPGGGGDARYDGAIGNAQSTGG